MADGPNGGSAVENADTKGRPSPRALRPLVPYALRYKGAHRRRARFPTLAAAATLTVPYGVRQMIDHGFTTQSAGAVNAYFSAMVAVVAVLALASGLRFYFVTTLGERVVADLRSDVFRHLTGLDASFFDRARTGELLSRLTADTTKLKATFGTSASVALRNFFMFVGAIGLMIYTSPKLSGTGSRRHSNNRPAAFCGRTRGAQEIARRTRHARRGKRLCGGEPCRRAGHAGFRRRGGDQRALQGRCRRGFRCGTRCDERPRHVDDYRHIPRLRQCRGSPLARRPRRPRRTHDGRRTSRNSCSMRCSARARSAN